MLQKIADVETNTEIRGVDFEELNDRLLKGKIDLGKQIRQQEQQQMTESKEFYLNKLLDFVSNVKNYFRNWISTSQ